jgi:hypothetical protein
VSRRVIVYDGDEIVVLHDGRPLRVTVVRVEPHRIDTVMSPVLYEDRPLRTLYPVREA